MSFPFLQFTEPRWSLDATMLLFDIIDQYFPDEVGQWDWELVATKMNRTPQECRCWFEFLQSVRRLIPIEDRKAGRAMRKRKRRKANEIKRAFKCQVNSCPKSYGTEGALKSHMRNKHRDVKYVPSYLFQYNQQPKQQQNLGLPYYEPGNIFIPTPLISPIPLLHHHLSELYEYQLQNIPQNELQSIELDFNRNQNNQNNHNVNNRLEESEESDLSK